MLTTTPIESSVLKRPLSTAPFHTIVSPEIAIEELNRRCQGNGDMYFTIVYGVLNVRTGVLSITQAGNPHPLYLPVNGDVVMLNGGCLIALWWRYASFEPIRAVAQSLR
jgi:sigma-B regulation protein RsbU (phosphoserine phosphatase)